MTNEFIQIRLSQYRDLFGQAECDTILKRLSTSKLFTDNLTIAVLKKDVPNAKTISMIIHSSHYKFLLANKRKIYFASLFFLLTLYKNFDDLGISINEKQFAKSLLEICENYGD